MWFAARGLEPPDLTLQVTSVVSKCTALDMDSHASVISTPNESERSASCCEFLIGCCVIKKGPDESSNPYGHVYSIHIFHLSESKPVFSTGFSLKTILGDVTKSRNSSL
jgi:hypothetical protein